MASVTENIATEKVFDIGMANSAICQPWEDLKFDDKAARRQYICLKNNTRVLGMVFLIVGIIVGAVILILGLAGVFNVASILAFPETSGDWLILIGFLIGSPGLVFGGALLNLSGRR